MRKWRCSTKGCPFGELGHDNWCGHYGDSRTHLHWPKKGMGGNNSASKIVAIACWTCHNLIDNFGGRIEIEDGWVRGFTRVGVKLFEREMAA